MWARRWVWVARPSWEGSAVSGLLVWRVLGQAYVVSWEDRVEGYDAVFVGELDASSTCVSVRTLRSGLCHYKGRCTYRRYVEFQPPAA